MMKFLTLYVVDNRNEIIEATEDDIGEPCKFWLENINDGEIAILRSVTRDESDKIIEYRIDSVSCYPHCYRLDQQEKMDYLESKGE